MVGSEHSVKTPPEVRRPRFYRGWVVVVAGCLAETVSIGAGSISFAILLQPMSAALGWSRTLLTGAVTAQSVLSLATAPLIGMATDRYGPRIVMTVGGVVAAVAYLAIGHITEPWQFYCLLAI